MFVNPAGFSVAELGALPAGSCGTYCVAGRQLSMKWADGYSTQSAPELGSGGFN